MINIYVGLKPTAATPYPADHFFVLGEPMAVSANFDRVEGRYTVYTDIPPTHIPDGAYEVSTNYGPAILYNMQSGLYEEAGQLGYIIHPDNDTDVKAGHRKDFESAMKKKHG